MLNWQVADKAIGCQDFIETTRGEMTMQPSAPAASPSPALLWTGRVISALPALALTLSGIMKFMPPSPEVEKGLDNIGWPIAALVPLGITELVATILYIFPRTSVLGAILITGYMGGAIATHARIGEAFYIQAAIGVLAWLGLYLRDARLRALIPLRQL
jgi:uncharacterized membrane protein YphA (DoxX/SURF4 family)